MKKRSKYNQNTSLKNPAIIMCAIAVIMIILIIIFNIRSKINTNKAQQTNQIEVSYIDIDNNSAYAKLIGKYFQALNESDAEKLISLFPENENYTKTNVENQLKQMYNTYEAECGSNVEITYEINQGAEVNGQTLEDVKSQMATAYGIKSGVSKVYAFEITLTRTGDITSASNKIYLNLANINGSWYIV